MIATLNDDLYVLKGFQRKELNSDGVLAVDEKGQPEM